MWLDLEKIFDRLSGNPNVRSIVLSGSGDRAFTTGLDVSVDFLEIFPHFPDVACRWKQQASQNYSMVAKTRMSDVGPFPVGAISSSFSGVSARLSVVKNVRA